MTTQTPQRDEILLEAGTNELEVLVFLLDGSPFGVNVAKVREVIRGQRPTTTPNMHSSVLGMINMRGSLVPIVDLAKHMKMPSPENLEMEDRRIIITEFNGRRTGFVVESVEQIYRMSWSKIRPAPDVDSLGTARDLPELSTCTGVLDLDGRLILMIDFESTADAIALEEKLHITKVENPDGVDRSSYRVLLADDSSFIRAAVTRVFQDSGYTNIEVCADGAAAWKAVQSSLADGQRPFDCVVSDIEMPMLDGLALTRNIRGVPQLASMPVVLFSSLISQDNMNKGEQVGATRQIAKPELHDVVRLVDHAVTGRLAPLQKSAA